MRREIRVERGIASGRIRRAARWMCSHGQSRMPGSDLTGVSKDATVDAGVPLASGHRFSNCRAGGQRMPVG